MSPQPTSQLRAGHVPTEVYDAAGGRPVVVVTETAGRPGLSRYAGVLLVLGAAGVGVLATVAVALVVLQLAAETAAAVGAAVPAGVGVSIALKGGRK